MKKPEVNKLLDAKFQELFAWYHKQDPDSFAKPLKENKWSRGQHLEHLRKSTRALNKAMKMPKLALWWKFGKLKREEHSYEFFSKGYKKKSAEDSISFKAPKYLTPGDIQIQQKSITEERLGQEWEEMKKNVDSYSEKALSTYAVPHPIFGKMSIREMILFTAFHTEHHLNLMKRDLTH